MKALAGFSDIHRHAPAGGRDDVIVCITPDTPLPDCGFFSVGIHPWDAEHATEEMFERLAEMAKASNVVAIGECGFDRLRGGDVEVQRQVFERQAELAKQLDKPLIIHCVHADDLLLRAKKRIGGSNEWIIHGFRGNSRRAAALVKAGFLLSINLSATPPDGIPDDYIYRESDSV